ncbi:hypothetical protein LBMAG42_41460 [Deltaproteobacteria bacterium]|nr:hypothetical protein LBMAG42_41460 [Deltaproteobacteria bacterium]
MTLDVERLAAAIPELSREEIAGLVGAWERRGADEPTDFIAWLHARGAVADDTLRRVARSSRGPVLVAADGALDAGNLRVLGEVGRGAMGEVLLARDERLHRTVALKRLDPRFLDDPTMVRRFVVEAQLTAQLDHPGIVPVHTMETPAGEVPNYAMKLVRGVTLKAWLTEARERAERKEGQPSRQSLASRLELFCQMCEPIAYAHARGVLHRDLKPDNVMVGPFGEVFVMDWGVARLLGGSEASRAAAVAGGGTEVGDAVGTPSYMSPEQARGENDALDGRSDQFTLGLLLFEMATLRRARASVKGGGVPMLIAATRGHLDPIVALGEPVSRELRAVIKKATSRAPGERYANVMALADDVRHVLRGEAVSAAPDSMVQRVGRALAHNRERVVVGLLVAALAIAALFAVVVAGGLALREVDRAAGDVRTARRVEIGAVVSERARSLDRALLRDEGLLRGLAAATPRALAGPGAGPVYMAASFAAPETAPPDLAKSLIYGGPTSFLHPDVVVAASFDPTAGAGRLAGLASLRAELAGVLVGSVESPVADEAAARALVLTHGTPVVWSYVATVDGAMVGYPGTGAYPPDYDPRTRPWYREGLTHESPGWGLPYVDESGMGLLLSCSMVVRDAAHAPLAVVGLDLTVRGLVETWLVPADLPAEGFLIADDGALIARSAPAGTAQGTGTFPFAEALATVREPAGGQAIVGNRFFAWSRLSAVPWTYVVVGEPGAIQ